MKNIKSRILFSVIALGALLAGCTKDPSPSVFDKPYDPGQPPVLTSIAPENVSYPIAGVTTLALTGSNFNPDTSKYIVWFDGVRAQILSIDPTVIRVRTPNFYKDSVKVRVSEIGSDFFSQTLYLNVQPSVSNAPGIDYEKKKVWSIAADNHGNLFASLTQMNGPADVNVGVLKMTAAGDTMMYASNGTEPYWTSMKVGPGDTVLTTRKFAALLYLKPNVVAAPVLYAATPGVSIDDFDYDANKVIWAGGSASAGIYRLTQNRKAVKFTFGTPVRSLRVFNNALYVADTTNVVYQIPINPDSTLGTPVKYFDIKSQAAYAARKISAITFDAAGNLYVGIDAAPGILVVSGANAAPQPLYFGLIGGKVNGFQWGTGSILYVVKDNGSSKTPQVLLKVDMQRQSAPYYGRE